MTLFLLTTGSVLLLASYIYSSIFARCGLNTLDFNDFKNSRFIYNTDCTKLCADFNLSSNTRTLAVFYLGYNHIDIDKLKKFYLSKNISSVTIYANGCSKSGGKIKQSEKVLKTDLELWLEYLRKMSGPNSKIILHGFSDTALSTFLCADKNNVCGLVLDSVHIYPIWIYKNVKSRLLRMFFKKKSRFEIAGTKNNILICSPETLSKDSCKLYELCSGKKLLYVYDKFDYAVFSKKLNMLIKHLKLPEESA